LRSVSIVFPHQLFADHPCLTLQNQGVWLTEDDLFFGDAQYAQCFHQQKLQLHLASMAYYGELLSKRNIDCHYLPYRPNESSLPRLFEALVVQKINVIHTLDPVDYILKRRLESHAAKNNVQIKWYKTPGFLNTQRQNSLYHGSKNRWFMADFYRFQRSRMKILLDGDKPIAGRWSFDNDNRKKIPKKELLNIPVLSYAAETPYHRAAIARIQSDFSHHLGDGRTVIYPATHKDAQRWLSTFFEQRFALFGPYEDAIVASQHWLYHSVLTPMLNIGLLTPKQVISQALQYAHTHQLCIASVEGFVRQIIGWREFMRATYSDMGVSMRKQNHWQHHRMIPDSICQGNCGIVPVDNVIKQVLSTGYCHHIERLMILGGFFFLCEFEPNEIYRWFMNMFVDSYDWVMVPNVYAMSQNADGGQITTKPYFSGSNYIIKMGNYKKGYWSDIWDALYWRWIIKHQNELSKNHRWAMMCQQVSKMNDAKKQTYIQLAEHFLQQLDNQKNAVYSTSSWGQTAI
tara:strand:- start:507 stop:2051 length:1545 start_codon:yes stop_codon:yes gene_type:complete